VQGVRRGLQLPPDLDERREAALSREFSEADIEKVMKTKKCGRPKALEHLRKTQKNAGDAQQGKAHMRKKKK